MSTVGSNSYNEETINAMAQLKQIFYFSLLEQLQGTSSDLIGRFCCYQNEASLVTWIFIISIQWKQGKRTPWHASRSMYKKGLEGVNTTSTHIPGLELDLMTVVSFKTKLKRWINYN